MKKIKRRSRRQPSLRFTPYAWAKLQFLRDQGRTEIGGFGIATEGDPLLIQDLTLVGQSCTAVTVRFDDQAVADYFDQQIDLGRRPETFARVWIHTHPGESALPSRTDERTFHRVFGNCEWAVMSILARGGDCTARLRFNSGPGADIPIDTRLDWTLGFPGSCMERWSQEYLECVRPEEPFRLGHPDAPVVNNDGEPRFESDLWEAAFW